MRDQELTERAIVQRLQRAIAEDQPALDELAPHIDALFASVHRRVLTYCRRRMNDSSRADEIAQEAIAIAYSKLPEFRGQSTLTTWVTGIAKNLCRAQNRRRRDLLTEDGVIEAKDQALSSLQALRREERTKLVRRAAKRLTNDEQEFVELRYVHELSPEQIEGLLDIPGKSGARGLQQRCKRKLQRELSSIMEELGHGTSLFRLTQ